MQETWDSVFECCFWLRNFFNRDPGKLVGPISDTNCTHTEPGNQELGDVVGLLDEVCVLYEKVYKLVESNKLASNTVDRDLAECSHVDGPIPVAPSIVLDGSLIGAMVQKLKDDGSNTNILSVRLVKKYQKKFNFVKEKKVMQQLKSDSNEDSSPFVVNRTLRIGDHLYTSNWAAFNSRFDVLLGMP